MRFKIMAELAAGQDYCVEQFLDLGVSGLRVGQYFTDEVHRSLDRQGAPFLPFDHDSRAVHLISGCDVEKQWFPLGRRYQNGRVGEQSLEFVKGFLSLRGPGEMLGFPK